MKSITIQLSRMSKLIGVAVFIFILLFSLFLNFVFLSDDDYEGEAGGQATTEEEEYCNVMGIELHGDLMTYISNDSTDENGDTTEDQSSSEDVLAALDAANDDEDIKVIMIEIDSCGGSPAAAEEINVAIKNSKKPVIAYIRSAGLSAAYWGISGADYIYALPVSDVGSIGATMSYVDNAKQNSAEGLTFNQLSTGKYKDAGSPDKVLTSEEKQLLMRDLNILKDLFVKTVSENRGIELAQVENLADGSSLVGQMALDEKLIDQIGSYDDVKEYIKKLIGEDVEVCW